MENFKCKKCGSEFYSLKSLSGHMSAKYRMTAKQVYDEYILNNAPNLCACGCGEETTFLSINKGYNKYIIGHASRVVNNWGHNPDALKKSHETQKKMYESGELRIWNKGLTIEDPRVKDNIEKVMANPDRAKKISEALKGVPKSEEHKRNLSKSKKK